MPPARAATGDQGAADVRVVAAVIGAREGAVWAFRRGPGRAHAGRYEFPGGKVEPGESDAEALARELSEELAIVAVVGAKLHERSAFHAPGAPFDIAFYHVTVTADPSQHLSDHDDARVVTLDRLGDLTWAPGDEHFIELLPALWAPAEGDSRGSSRVTNEPQ